MSRFWETNRLLLATLGTALLVFLASHFVVTGYFTHDVVALEGTIKEKELEVRKMRHPSGVSIVNMTDHMRRETSRLRENRAALMDALSASFPAWTTPPENVRADAHFSQKHAEINRKLDGDKYKYNVSLEDEHLGFPPKVIEKMDEKTAPENLKKLAMVEKLIRLLFEARVSRIITVRPKEVQVTGARKPLAPGQEDDDKHRGEYTPFIREFPVEIVVITPIKPLMEFLHSVRQKDQFLIIRNIVIHNRHAKGLETHNKMYQGLGEDELRVTITAAGMRFLSDKEVTSISGRNDKRNALTARARKPKHRVPHRGH